MKNSLRSPLVCLFVLAIIAFTACGTGKNSEFGPFSGELHPTSYTNATDQNLKGPVRSYLQKHIQHRFGKPAVISQVEQGFDSMGMIEWTTWTGMKSRTESRSFEPVIKDGKVVRCAMFVPIGDVKQQPYRELTYDQQNRVAKIKEVYPNHDLIKTFVRKYNEEGRLTEEKPEPHGTPVHYKYDDQNRLIGRIKYLGKTWEFDSINSYGDIVSHLNLIGVRSRSRHVIFTYKYEYDSFNNWTSRKMYKGETDTLFESWERSFEYY